MLSHAFYVCGKKASLLHHHILGRRRRFFSRETHLKHLRMLCWALSAACTHIKRPDGTNQQTLSWPGDVTSCSHTPIPCFFCRGVCVSVCVAPHTSLLKYLQCFTVCRSDLHQSVMAVADLSLRNLSIYGWKHGAPQESVRLCVIMCEIRQFFVPECQISLFMLHIQAQRTLTEALDDTLQNQSQLSNGYSCFIIFHVSPVTSVTSFALFFASKRRVTISFSHRKRHESQLECDFSSSIIRK